MPDITENACTACEGLGEVECQGSYYDFEPPTKKCTECNGTGEGEIQEWVMGSWRDACKRSIAMDNDDEIMFNASRGDSILRGWADKA